MIDLVVKYLTWTIQEVMNNLMISNLAFKAEEDPDVASYAFHKHVTVQVSIPAYDFDKREGCMISFFYEEDSRVGVMERCVLPL